MATNKPGVKDSYIKNVYSEIANYPPRQIPYFKDKPRYKSIYTSDYIENLQEDAYTKRNATLKEAIDKYEYSENPVCLEMLSDKSKLRNENFIKEGFELEKEGPYRKAAFSNWTSSYDNDNKVAEEAKSKYDFKPSEIDDHFKARYHKYHPAYYRTEATQYQGLYGDNPFEKFFLHDQPKIHSSNYKIGLGTTKPTTAFIPGYQGHIPVNRLEYHNERIYYPYFNANKANHILNYSPDIPNYMGYKPSSVMNFKSDTKTSFLSNDSTQRTDNTEEIKRELEAA